MLTHHCLQGVDPAREEHQPPRAEQDTVSAREASAFQELPFDDAQQAFKACLAFLTA